jgi:hypothetical protein
MIENIDRGSTIRRRKRSIEVIVANERRNQALSIVDPNRRGTRTRIHGASMGIRNIRVDVATILPTMIVIATVTVTIIREEKSIKRRRKRRNTKTEVLTTRTTLLLVLRYPSLASTELSSPISTA